MDYTKLAKEAYKMYAALRDEKFDANQAYGITKVCVRDYPIFREMIEKEQSPEEVVGYIHFIDGHKIPFYNTKWDSTINSTILTTEEGIYRISDELVHDLSSFLPTLRSAYYKHDGTSWYRLYSIDHVEYL